MSDDDDDVLRDRFRSHQPDQTDNSGDANNSYDTSDANGTHGANKSGEPNNAYNTGDTGKSNMTDATHETQEADSVRERKQEAMYLRPEQREQLRDFYDELDGRSKITGEGGLAKNDDFYEALMTFVLDERREEFIEFLGLEEL